MDNFWLFVIIIGAVISLAQKSQQKPSSESDGEPHPNPQQDWERQIRELLGEKTTEKQQTPPAQKQARPATIESSPKKTAIPTLSRASKRVERTINSAKTYDKPLRTVAAVAGTSVATHNNNQGEILHSPSEEEYNEKIAQILDDFSMEKAVIYSEILKPKYEEY